MTNFGWFMFFRLRFFLFFILILTTVVFPSSNVPNTLFVQATIGINGDTLYSVTIKMDIGIYKSDVDDVPLWMETFDGENKIQLNQGNFFAVLGKMNPIPANIFIEQHLRIGFTPYINGEKQQTSYIPMKSVPYAFHSEISNQAETIQNDDLIKFDFVNMRVGINNQSPQYTLDVTGTVNATTFIGDGSQLTNIQVSDDRLVWVRGTNGMVYYSSGNVGINTESPQARLHVEGNTLVSGNLSVLGLLSATSLKGDGSKITNLNASQINQGVIDSDRVSGDYTKITGLGEITSGIWKATPIEDDYIDNVLTLNNAKIEGSNTISGNLQVVGPTKIQGNHDFSITSPAWQINNAGELFVRSVSVNGTVLITGNVIQTDTKNGLHIKPRDHLGMFISPLGYIGVNTTTPLSHFDVNGGIRLGMTTNEVPGLIRFNTITQNFEGFKLDKDGIGQWIQLDYDAQFDSHALHAEGNQIKNIIYVNSNGNIGIGGIESTAITDHLMTSGNVVFQGRSFSPHPLPDIAISGSGTRMMWYPKKTAFRLGYVDSNQWDDENIGQNSVVFGHSGLANSPHAVILGGKLNTVNGESSVIVGGQNNIIHSNVNYSTIIGGGGSGNSGNKIGDGSTTSQYSTIVGGHSNTITGKYSTIIGGVHNHISGNYSMALGKDITIDHQGVFVYSNLDTPVASTGDGQFLIYAKGNVGIAGAPSPDHALTVGGLIKATAFVGDGSRLLNISATKLNGYPASTTHAPNSIYVSDSNGYLPEGTVAGSSIKSGSITGEKISPGSITSEQIKIGAISSDKIAINTITSDHISPGAISSSKIQAASITSKNIKDASIVSRNIAPNSIKSKHIAMHQVTNSKIALNTIDSSRIVDATITSKDIALGAIESFNIKEDAIQAHHIAHATVISDNISENAIQSQHLNELIISSRNIQDNAIQSHHILDFNVENRHIATNAIQSFHIADAVITNERIIDNSITSEKISPNAILGKHIDNFAIESRHISENAILEHHIADIAIDGSKISNLAIESRNIALNAITNDRINTDAIETYHILDETIVSKDIALGTIPNTLLAENSIMSIHIAKNGIASFNLQDNSISSINIIDGSITSADIMDETIDATIALETGGVTSEKIQENAIQNHHLADGAISSRNIETESLPWDKITNDPIPVSTIADNSIPGSKIMDGTIPGNKILEASITSDKLANNSISTNALIGVLQPSKGGTGLQDLSSLAGGIVMGVEQDGKVTLGGDKSNLSWNHDNHFLGINTSDPQAALHVKGNILTEGGSVYFGNLNNSISFGQDETTNPATGFIIIGPDINPGEPITNNTEPKGTVKTNKLIVTDKVGIGVMSPQNALDIAGNMAIGENFAGNLAPPNGLIIEGNVGIGVQSPSHALEVNGSILAKGIIGQAGENGIGIQGIGGSIGIQSDGANIGIDVTAKEIGVKAVSSGETGVSIVIKNAAENSSTGVKAELIDDLGNTIVGGLATIQSDYSAAVFGEAPTIENKTNWAAYFDGPVKITDYLGIGLASNESPKSPLHVKENALFEKSIHTKIHSKPDSGGLEIDWENGNKVSFNCNSSRTITFKTPQQNGVYFLNSIVNVSGENCKLLFYESKLKWENGLTLDSNTPLINESTYIFTFILFKENDSNYNYYGMKPARYF
jgi:hypothetical protein